MENTNLAKTLANLTKSSVRIVRAECAIHGPYTTLSYIEPNGNLYTGACPQCNLEKQLRLEEEAHKDAVSRKESDDTKAVEKRLIDAGVQEDDLHCTFASYDTGDDPSVQDVVNGYMHVCDSDTLNLTVIGKTGRGKTHLAIATMRKIAENDTEGKITMRYIRESRMLRDMKASFSNPALKSEQQIIDELSAVDVLVIDEIGKASTTAYNAVALEEILAARHTRRRTIIIGNVTEDELKDHLTDGSISRLSHKAEKKLLNTFADYRRRKQA